MQKRSVALLIAGIIFLLFGMLHAWSLLSFFYAWVYLGLASFLFELLLLVIRFAMGIAGILNWKKPHKASGCFVLGVVAFSVFIIAVLWGWVYDSLALIEFLLLNIVLQVALTGLYVTYILAAYKLAKSSHDTSVVAK